MEYKPERMYLQPDHLSRVSVEMGTSPIDDRFIDDNLFLVTSSPDWYAGIVEFLTTQRLPVEWTKEARKKVRVNSGHFAVVGNRLFRIGADGILRRRVSESEVLDILTSCHDSSLSAQNEGSYVIL